MFADDTVQLVESGEQLQYLLREVRRIYKKKSLVVNTEKNDVVLVGREEVTNHVNER